MPISTNWIVETYSRLAQQYDDDANVRSCWGQAAEKALASIVLRKDHKVILDVGCGTGRALVRLAANKSGVRFIGIDPAENMRQVAMKRAATQSCIEILDGCFERMPIASASIDYLFSILAFHWATDLRASVREIARVLKPNAEMDLFFIGRNNGREFIQKTTAIFWKYMGPARLLASARLRKQLTREEALGLFSEVFERGRLSVEESYETYYDTLEGHMAWWVRIEGHFVQISPEKRRKCDEAVQDALASLAEPLGIPYTIHLLHLQLRQPV